MKIAFDAKRAYNNFSGLGNYSRNLIRQMLKHYPEHKYFLYTPKIKSDWIDLRNQNAIICSPESFSGKLLPSFWRTFALSRRIVRDGIDIFHGLSNELPVGIHKTGVKSVVTIHDLIFLRYPGLYKPIDRNIYKKKLTYCVKAADHIIAISEQTKNDIINFTGTKPEKISVVYQTCDPSFSKLASEAQKEKVLKKYKLTPGYIIYVGTIEERKNLLSIIRALHEGSIDYPLVVIGRETSYAQKVHDYINKNRMKNIHFLKNVPNEDLPVLYQLANIFIYPSSFEGFGIPVLEALNSGVPVIAGKGSCLEETGGPASLYIEPEDVSSLSEMIRILIDTPEKREQMIKAGYKHAENFTEKKMMQEIFKIYESIL